MNCIELITNYAGLLYTQVHILVCDAVNPSTHAPLLWLWLSLLFSEIGWRETVLK